MKYHLLIEYIIIVVHTALFQLCYDGIVIACSGHYLVLLSGNRFLATLVKLLARGNNK